MFFSFIKFCGLLGRPRQQDMAGEIISGNGNENV
jgi:hypothetical protein